MQPVGVDVASLQLQDMMEEVGEWSLDFVYLSIGDLIGKGATALVYSGTYDGKNVAVKVVAPTELDDSIINSFVDETKMMKKINHPCILKFYGICVRPPQIGLVIEFCKWGTLKSCLRQLPWTPYRKIKAAVECATAVAYLHSLGIIHRDLKCDNFFVDDNLNVKLGDFGESTYKKRNGSDRKMTIVGTVAYMAPELVYADKSYTEAIDVYALAITIWEIWTQSEPFGDVTNFLRIYEKVQRGERPAWPSDAPSELVKLIELAWADAPQNRPKARELQKSLENILQNTPSDKSENWLPQGRSQSRSSNATEIMSGFSSYFGFIWRRIFSRNTSSDGNKKIGKYAFNDSCDSSMRSIQEGTGEQNQHRPTFSNWNSTRPSVTGLVDRRKSYVENPIILESPSLGSITSTQSGNIVSSGSESKSLSSVHSTFTTVYEPSGDTTSIGDVEQSSDTMSMSERDTFSRVIKTIPLNLMSDNQFQHYI